MKSTIILLLVCIAAKLSAQEIRITVINDSKNAVSIGHGQANKIVEPRSRTVYQISKADVDNGIRFNLFLTSDLGVKSVKDYLLFDSSFDERSFTIQSEGSIQSEISKNERLFATFRDNYSTRKNPESLKKFILEHKGDLASAEAILYYMCYTDNDVETISKYYSQLNPDIRSSKIGSQIQRHLDGKQRLSIGAKIPDFTLPDTSGNLINLYSSTSDFVLIDFWFSTCGPCIESFPKLKQLYISTSRTELEIIGVSIDKRKASWLSSIREHNIQWEQMIDTTNAVSHRLFSVMFYPTTILVQNATKKIVSINPSVKEIEAIVTKQKAVNLRAREEISPD
ncbi:MAG: TlpA disulfide reductase family protein [Chitinophagaceae bacterium]